MFVSRIIDAFGGKSSSCWTSDDPFIQKKRPILTPFQRENRKIQGAGQKRKVQQTLEFTGLFWRRVRDSNPRFLLGTRHFESSGENRTWRNLAEDNGKCENPENAVFSRLCTPICVENAAKIRVRKSPPISPSSNGFSEKPIRIFDRTERFFVPKSRFWQCVKSAGYAEPHQKSCEKMPG